MNCGTRQQVERVVRERTTAGCAEHVYTKGGHSGLGQGERDRLEHSMIIYQFCPYPTG
jgi:hypothetical protein